jgi:hypothetical protein
MSLYNTRVLVKQNNAKETHMKAFKFNKGKSVEDLKKHKGAGGGVSKYKWDAMFAEPCIITQGDDYEVETDAMLPKIKTAARRRYKVVEVYKTDAEGVKLVGRVDKDGKAIHDQLILIPRDMTPDERTAEDAKRAEEKLAKASETEATTPATPTDEPEGVEAA